MSNKIPEGGYVDPNWPNPHGPNDSVIVIYGYTPSLVLALLAAVLFGVTTVVHSVQLWIHRPCWWFTPLTVGCAFEVVGYTFRTLSADWDPYNVIYFVVSYFFIVVAPVFFSAAIYAVLSILINRAGSASAPILSPRAILAVFITCDVIATGVQIAGAATIGKAESNREDPTTPNNILLAGLAFQVFSFAVFLVLLGLFFVKARKVATTDYASKPFLVALVTAALLIYLRTCFRLAETAEGVYGPLMTNETLFGVLEFAPVASAVLTLIVWHPGRCISSPKMLHTTDEPRYVEY